MDDVALSGGNYQAGQIKMLNVQMGKCPGYARGHIDVVRSIVFTPDGKSLLSSSWDTIDISTQGLNRDLTVASHFVGHIVRQLPGLFFWFPLTYSLALSFRRVFLPFLYPLMVNGLRLAHWTRLLKSGMRILLHCSVSCMVMERFRLPERSLQRSSTTSRVFSTQTAAHSRHAGPSFLSPSTDT